MENGEARVDEIGFPPGEKMCGSSAGTFKSETTIFHVPNLGLVQLDSKTRLWIQETISSDGRKKSHSTLCHISYILGARGQIMGFSCIENFKKAAMIIFRAALAKM
ncbi:hypothetical protein SKAU_G00387560 [Synaphobranchus kaupii]|uniref:Uncharacterized protein n=1 Tax=Synaphobranchus kaupii TaxID=118154 RepID=A0A9Q1ID90_SYNKA|nr:hypothetical protein SKAU_G00387560 [Synaphobranchus kaupii]